MSHVNLPTQKMKNSIQKMVTLQVEHFLKHILSEKNLIYLILLLNFQELVNYGKIRNYI